MSGGNKYGSIYSEQNIYEFCIIIQILFPRGFNTRILKRRPNFGLVASSGKRGNCVCTYAEGGAASSAGDKNTLRRVLDFVRETTDDNLHDINRKLQRVLEETLTKNMHLQQVS